MKILITRTDRIGDVLLSTPAIKAVRDAHPEAHIAVMVRPYAEEIVRGNPYINEVIIYDKYARHKNFLSTFFFALGLRKKNFDLAIHLHPTNRCHVISFLAGIPQRVGYDIKCGFLLTKKIPHTKQEGKKHEIDYTLDVVRSIGIEVRNKELYMPIIKEAEEKISGLLQQEGLSGQDRLVVLHPGASCLSKRWPEERFAMLGEKLIENYGVKVALVSGPNEVEIVARTAKLMGHHAINLCGKTSIGELAALLKRAELFISNDSGPVHMAVAVGTPVIAIFGRSDKGLSPKRWGPTGPKDIILHKHVGCDVCLAHNCQKDFACLKAITVDDVMEISNRMLEKNSR